MISFVIPAYNEEALLASCIASIAVEMNTDYEIIVVDNGSTDLTADIARYFSTKVINEPTKGVVWARQAGYAEAQGDLIAFIDADSEVPNGWLAIMLRAMSDERIVACSGPLVYTDMNLAKRIMTSAFYTLGALLSRILPMVQGGNFVARKSALKAVDGWPGGVCPRHVRMVVGKTAERGRVSDDRRAIPYKLSMDAANRPGVVQELPRCPFEQLGRRSDLFL
jgi:glycosyltransferase involved in cell wall biosynthesis